MNQPIWYYDQLLYNDQSDAHAWISRALSLSHLAKHNKTIECFDKALRIDPDDPDRWSFGSEPLYHSRIAKYEQARQKQPQQQQSSMWIDDELTKLAALKEKGIISEEEFQHMKQDLIKNSIQKKHGQQNTIILFL